MNTVERDHDRNVKVRAEEGRGRGASGAEGGCRQRGGEWGVYGRRHSGCSGAGGEWWSLLRTRLSALSLPVFTHLSFKYPLRLTIMSWAHVPPHTLRWHVYITLLIHALRFGVDMSLPPPPSSPPPPPHTLFCFFFLFFACSPLLTPLFSASTPTHCRSCRGGVEAANCPNPATHPTLLRFRELSCFGGSKVAPISRASLSSPSRVPHTLCVIRVDDGRPSEEGSGLANSL